MLEFGSIISVLAKTNYILKEKEYNMKKISFLLALALMLGTLTACGSHDEETHETHSSEQQETLNYYPVTFTDEAGNEVTIPEKPTNVALAGTPPFPAYFLQFTNDTSLLGAIGSNAFNFPVWIERVFPDFASINTVGWGAMYEVEDILATNPDLIICASWNEENYNIFLESGIPTVGIDSTYAGTNTLMATNGWYEILGKIYNLEDKADALIENSNRISDLLDEKVATISESDKLSGLMMPDYSENIIEVSNNDYYGGFWLEKAGLTNVAENAIGWESNMEEVIAMNPDVIYLSAFSDYNASDMLADNAVPGHTWSVTNAGETGNIYKFPVGIFNWYALSPDAPITALWVACNAYPEVFADVDLNAEVKNHYSLLGIELTDDEVENILVQY